MLILRGCRRCVVDSVLHQGVSQQQLLLARHFVAAVRKRVAVGVYTAPLKRSMEKYGAQASSSVMGSAIDKILRVRK